MLKTEIMIVHIALVSIPAGIVIMADRLDGWFTYPIVILALHLLICIAYLVGRVEEKLAPQSPSDKSLVNTLNRLYYNNPPGKSHDEI